MWKRPTRLEVLDGVDAIGSHGKHLDQKSGGEARIRGAGLVQVAKQGPLVVALLLHSGSGIGGDQSGVNLPVPGIQLFGFLGVLHRKRSLEELDGRGGGQQSGRDVVGVGDEDALKIVQRLARLIIFERSHALGQGGAATRTGRTR